MGDAIKTLFRGFLLGIGFCVAAGLVYYVSWQVYFAKAQEETLAKIGAGSEGPDLKALVLSGVEEQKHDGVTAIIGTAKNTGQTPIRSAKLQANLFNHGKFVDQYSTYLSGTLGPGDLQYFKISCGCKDSPPAEHDSFKVEAIKGY